MSQQRSVRTRRLLLLAAAEEFAARGYSGARLKTVVDRIGMTKGALYGHFASKAELARAVADEAASHWDALSAQRPARPSDPVCELRRLAAQLARLMDDDTVFRAAVRLASDGRRGSRERDLVALVSDRLTELARRAQQEAGPAAAFGPVALADLVTTAIFAGVRPGTENGIGSHARLNGLWGAVRSGRLRRLRRLRWQRWQRWQRWLRWLRWQRCPRGSVRPHRSVRERQRTT
ncbi:TetR/AcrR family transcriptional regulator [Streptomyces sp. B-S-A8]|uniref:TetR/AcrR family transcriptional regulator n=1 Tax=Streptomyces solicavernae TaxID=3043614 RepID=A0ABT6S4A0_9ACTN|nr:TetR/AcrR family transcriptional regulator [Streptomyces sp. B-S-A8]MDI3390701.1 TetR/AcrR family transcriptional regulator [Streptomyces sp. B-S-A8]